jgi:16S rRNA C967 or C1407 C5-methylase (RsmB/RsmF family)
MKQPCLVDSKVQVAAPDQQQLADLQSASCVQLLLVNSVPGLIYTARAAAVQVRGVILDPSCSGSGTVVSRMDHLLPQAEQQPQEEGTAEPGSSAEAAEQQRVEQLAKFQVGLVLRYSGKLLLCCESSVQC